MATRTGGKSMGPKAFKQIGITIQTEDGEIRSKSFGDEEDDVNYDAENTINVADGVIRQQQSEIEATRIEDKNPMISVSKDSSDEEDNTSLGTRLMQG